MSVTRNLQHVRAKVAEALAASPWKQQCTLVAVSKTKPVADVEEAYNQGQRHFGENYIQELVEKAPLCPADIQWHFIGHLQSNKVKALVTGVPSLYMVESVDSVKLANKLDSAWATKGTGKPLAVLVQVNTSGEEQKSGVAPEDCVALASHIQASCANLAFQGLMTIGRFDDETDDCFVKLVACRKEVGAALGIDEAALALSMGMSDDFESAIAHGSTYVRVGSTIFGRRNYAT
ncbi:YggS family pyridoxal phosphate enzyme [Saprolegnia parasitica CBS 223.65]|uniref:Pyridoxal phosphate homeostasis protein n=1 Tax=Saprolegnia parasitica (strain CBS 223.65) TaxID=695850 RepID=A0A067CFH2_SAPPC|nr:YggS family pyridoxal phosphate enzyme [Saprolegnia parasitica CBS 223.65]KDO29509.1 YggS family pyridoxal phosphate enzyme [Saprolegnia parasitica CBS 223.65]|eukprot:XP_012199575.1 YggS family pyridoxal phosphate enzyme [Saprolegnia parasitica CBS 223.65]